MSYEIRTVGAEEWAELKALRLTALRDPVARVAFIESYDNVHGRADEFWQARAVPLAEGGGATSLVAVDSDGTWVAMLTILDETRDRTVLAGESTDGTRGTEGTQDTDGTGSGGAGSAGQEAVLPQTHIVGVYVLPEHRGTGAAELLLRGAVEWSWENTAARRVRLWVHGDNPRAFAFYTRLGFTKTGETAAFPPMPEETEYELVLPRPESASPLAS
ncbi:GNAT family N-acetyltransferase [Streptomyces sp. URMC 123]|uniref:GNAT family N-acetyltransferase n=1 Tax=Streptomyces sp. URMC 123 TaxID=3423403 RepID=UPI003F19C2DE